MLVLVIGEGRVIEKYDYVYFDEEDDFVCILC